MQTGRTEETVLFLSIGDFEPVVPKDKAFT